MENHYDLPQIGGNYENGYNKQKAVVTSTSFLLPEEVRDLLLINRAGGGGGSGEEQVSKIY